MFAVIEAPGEIDGAKLQADCTQLHNANEALRSVMPTPDPNLTVEVQQAIDNFDNALHSCSEALDTGNLSKDFVRFLATAEQHFSRGDTILVALAAAG